jgi:tetratricopeptide (TPR) repeat protein
LSYQGSRVLMKSRRPRQQSASAITLCLIILMGSGALAADRGSDPSLLAQSYSGRDPDLLMQAGTTALRANHLDDAMAKFQAACEAAPNLADAHHQWGIALVKAGRASEAVDQFKTAIALNPQQAASWLSLGGAYQSAGDLTDAINAYSDFVSHFPQDRDNAKVRQLITLLKREPSNSTALPAPDQSGQATASPNLINKPKDRPAPVSSRSDTVGGADDYFKEVTRSGVLRWPARQMPLKIFIDDGNGVSGYRPVFTGILKQAFMDWADASNGLVKVVFVPDILKANIICRWSDQPEKFKNSAEAGESRLYSDRYGIAKGELAILTVASSPTLPITDNRLRAIVLHEVGHMFGMTGHTADPRDIMFYSASTSDAWRDLSARDKATLVHLYRED